VLSTGDVNELTIWLRTTWLLGTHPNTGTVRHPLLSYWSWYCCIFDVNNVGPVIDAVLHGCVALYMSLTML